ncbi:MAG TPA: sigma-70 family RNA polymerase sigma factor [Kofleriaceae bacterium]
MEALGQLADGDAQNPARPDDPDRQLVELARTGQARVACHLLMHRYGTDVYRFCRTELRDDALAEDVQQVVFLQAYHHLPGFEGKSTVKTWLFAIARHRVLDASKARRRARAHLEDDAVDPSDPGPPADQQLDAARAQRYLAECLARLGEPTRTAILLRYQQGFSFDEMAEICGERAGTLQARVARALPRLKAMLELKRRLR